MPRSVSRPSVQPAAVQASTPKQAKAAAPQAPAPQAQAAGWGAKAAGAGAALKVSAASIGDGPKTTDTVQVPAGYTAKSQTFTDKQSTTVHGQKASIEQSVQQVTVSGPGGKKFTVGEGQEAIKGFASDWKSEMQALKAEAKPEYLPMTEWSAESGVRGAGVAGSLFSVSQSGSSYMGGAHPNHGSALSTFDARTGQQVKLDQLLTPKQLHALTKDIEARLKSMAGPDGIEGSSFHWGDTAALQQTINENFSVSQDKSGKVQLHIAWESGIHALGGVMAHFTVDAPSDPAFLQKIGVGPGPNTWLPDDAP